MAGALIGPKRIAYARIAQETNALSPLRTTLDDFHRTHWLEGDALDAACQRGAWEVPKFMRNAELSGFVRAARQIGRGRVAAVPLFSAWAIPSGPLSREAFAVLRDKLVAELEAKGPFDGLFLSVHGALRADGSGDPEADLYEAARGVLGDRPIAASYDLHGAMNARKVAGAPLLAAYRTNPHRDHERTGYRAGALLVRAVLGEITPTIAWRTLPMVLGGGLNLDFMAPMRALFAKLHEMDKRPGVLSTSLFMCQLWCDAPDLGWAAYVATDGDQALAERTADELADLLWSVRHELPPELPDASAAIREARAATWARRLGTVCISDASDMVGAGATGENTHLLRALLTEAGDLVSYAPIRDPIVVEALWTAPIGTLVRAAVGGRSLAGQEPLPIEGTLVHKRPEGPFGRSVTLDLGHIKLVITEAPPLAMRPSFYTDVGLDPWRADICVVKSLFPFRLYFLLHNRRTIYARTGGITDFDAYKQLTFDGPVHPKDVVEAWRPTDARRRGLACVESS